MKVSDILAHLAVRLNDVNVDSSKLAGSDTSQSEAFLIKLIEFHQNSLCAEFDCNIAKFEKALNKASEVESDFEMLKLIAAFLGNAPLNLMTQSFAIKHKLLGQLYFFEIEPKKYGFSQAVTGNLELYGVKKASLADKNAELVLSDDFTNLLVMSVFVDLYRSQVSPDNTARLDYFTKIVESEKAKITARLNQKRTQTAFTSPFIKV